MHNPQTPAQTSCPAIELAIAARIRAVLDARRPLNASVKFSTSGAYWPTAGQPKGAPDMLTLGMVDRPSVMSEARRCAPSRPRMRVRALLVIGCVLSASGCGSSRDDPASDPQSTAPLQLPKVVYQGGPLLRAPAVVSITFAGDALAPDLDSFGQTVASSSWWDAVTIGYCATANVSCVGAGPQGTSVQLAAAPDATYSDSDDGSDATLQMWLSSSIASGVLPAPAPGAPSNTLYVLYFPATTTVTFDGVASCTDEGFDGYHNWMSVGSQSIAYAVVMECPPLPPPTPGVTAPTVLENTTLSASHEIVEASTDPAPPGSSNSISPGFALDGTSLDNFGWIDVTGGGEAGDMCVDFFGLNQDQTSDAAFTVQRIWSNAQAASGVDPCNPIPSGDLYFNAAPEGTAFFVVGVGQSQTFYVDAFAQSGMGSWTLTAQDWSDSSVAYLSFSIAGATSTSAGPQIPVSDGSRVALTMTLLADPGPLVSGEADGAIISLAGDPTSPTRAHFWPIAVMSPQDAVASGISTSDDNAVRAALAARRSRRRSRRHHPGSNAAVRWRF